MGWMYCGEDSKGRKIGYGIVATCDFPGCNEQIDRGLAYACGGMHGDEGQNGEPCCDGYFCGEHLYNHGCIADWPQCDEEDKYMMDDGETQNG